MQYQKSEVRERILRSADDEFFRLGFLGAKIGAVAKSAGVPVGNLYRYFGCKEILFEAVVGQAYSQAALKIALAFESCFEGEIADKNSNSNAIREKLILAVVELFDQFGREIVMLMDGSEGSNFSDFARIVYDSCRGFFVRRLCARTEDDRVFCGLVSRSAVDMVVQLFRSGDRGLLQRLLPRLVSNFSAY